MRAKPSAVTTLPFGSARWGRTSDAGKEGEGGDVSADGDVGCSRAVDRRGCSPAGTSVGKLRNNNFPPRKPARRNVTAPSLKPIRLVIPRSGTLSSDGKEDG